MGVVYLIHFEKPYKHAKHYIGYVEDEVDGLDKRIDMHTKGNGSTLMRVVVKSGIKFEVVRTWSDVDRNFERKLKNRGGASRICPHCKKKLNDK